MAHPMEAFNPKVFARESAGLSVSFDGQGTAQIHYKVAWADSIAFMAALLGLPPPNNPDGPQREPHTHPEVTSLKCLNTDREPHGKFESPVGELDLADFPYARIIADYGIPAYDVSLDQPTADTESTQPFGAFAEETRDYSVEFLTTNQGFYTWKSDVDAGLDPPGQVDVPVGIQMPAVDRTYILRRVSSVNYTFLINYVGYVNSDTYAGAPPGTLLFLGAATKRAHGGNDLAPFEVGLKFKERWAPWNFYFRPDATQEDSDGNKIHWQEITPNPYPTISFSSIFSSQNIRIRV